jgi:HSP20 family molecular chaperone IbpA
MEEVKVTKQQSVAKREAAPASRAKDIFAPMVPFGRWFGLSPFALMREFTDEMDRAFRGVAPGMTAGAELSAWSPAVDVRQCNGDLVVTAELPGLKKERSRSN